MSTIVRSAFVPLDHVYAEILAYPIASESSFRWPDRGRISRRLWDRLELEQGRYWPGVSLDELASLRDRVWFGTGRGEPNDLASYLRAHAASLLRCAGETAIPSPPSHTVDISRHIPISSDDEEMMVAARRRWRWVTFALPSDLLLAALPGDPPPSRITALTPGLEWELKTKGYAEPHLHVGAGLEFTELWAGVQFALADRGFDPRAFRSKHADFNDGVDLGGWLLRTAVARCLIAAYLARIRKDDLSFSEFVDEGLGPRIRRQRGATTWFAIRSAMVGLMKGGPAPIEADWASLRLFYRDLYDAHGPSEGSDLQHPRRLDPVVDILEIPDSDERSGEWHWVRAGLARVETRRDDGDFEQIFWQVVRARNIFYRHIVQRPMIPGLRWFLHFFKRIKAGRRWFDVELGRILGSAVRLQGRNDGLRSLEARTKPFDSWVDYDRMVRAVQNWRDREIVDAGHPASIEVGLILHFGKERGGDESLAHGAGTHADPSTEFSPRPRGGVDPRPINPTGFRYAEFHRARDREATSWCEYLRHHPEGLRILRGVDICSDERAIPNWVLLGPYRRVVDASREASARLRDGTPAFGRTIHAGEDFVHPASGLRVVAEALRYFELGAGDRLGHALALGVDMSEWVRLNGRTAMRREERLFDLVWEWDWCSRRRSPGADRLPFLMREIRRLGKEVFDAETHPRELQQLVDDLHDPESLRSVGFPDGVYAMNVDPDRSRLLYRYLTDPGIYGRGQVTEWTVVSDEGEILTRLQEELRREVGRRGIIVEVNPSSNLLIGNFGDLKRHPFWRLAGPPGSDSSVAPITVCIGSDDPITFATDIRHEYQLVYDSLISAGRSAEEALTWIARVRESSLSVKFTLPSSTKPTDRSG